MCGGQPLGDARDAERVRPAVPLIEVVAHAPCGANEFPAVRDHRSAALSAARRLAYSAPLRFPAHITSALSLLSL